MMNLATRNAFKIVLKEQLKIFIIFLENLFILICVYLLS
jgi:hypothetical protein